LCPFSVLFQHPSGDGDEEEELDRFQGGLQIGGRVVTNLRCADDIDILAVGHFGGRTTELVDRLDRVDRKYSQWQSTIDRGLINCLID